MPWHLTVVWWKFKKIPNTVSLFIKTRTEWNCICWQLFVLIIDCHSIYRHRLQTTTEQHLRRTGTHTIVLVPLCCSAASVREKTHTHTHTLNISLNGEEMCSWLPLIHSPNCPWIYQLVDHRRLLPNVIQFHFTCCLVRLRRFFFGVPCFARMCTSREWIVENENEIYK